LILLTVQFVRAASGKRVHSLVVVTPE